MNIKISKTAAQEDIEKFFKEIEDKTPKEVKKIKRLAANKKILLKEKRKLFCKKCLAPYKKSKIRIKGGKRIVECENCGFISRFKLKRL
ncbi:hypothetical protein KAJ87_03320 [Candidatus Pacearchaeota archaeon]|nr:hypothetical protein [Candidatus Pacearchaeota archaeon]